MGNIKNSAFSAAAILFFTKLHTNVTKYMEKPSVDSLLKCIEENEEVYKDFYSFFISSKAKYLCPIEKEVEQRCLYYKNAIDKLLANNVVKGLSIKTDKSIHRPVHKEDGLKEFFYAPNDYDYVVFYEITFKDGSVMKIGKPETLPEIDDFEKKVSEKIAKLMPVPLEKPVNTEIPVTSENIKEVPQVKSTNPFLNVSQSDANNPNNFFFIDPKNIRVEDWFPNRSDEKKADYGNNSESTGAKGHP